MNLPFRQHLRRTALRQFILSALAAGDTQGLLRTKRALWPATRAQAGAQIHQPLRIGFDLLCRQQAFSQGPQGTLDGCRAGKTFNAETARQHPFDVAVENRRARAKSENGNRRRRRAPDARQVGQIRRRRRKLPGMALTDDLSATVQIARPCVITQPGPVLKYRIQRRPRQRRNLREGFEKAPVIGNNRRNLGLLQHDFRQPHPVGITPPLPRQIMSALLLLPEDQVFRESAHRIP